MQLIKDAFEYLAVWWFRTAYGANTELMCMVVAPILFS